MTPEELKQRLATAFEEHGVVGGPLLPVLRAEDDNAEVTVGRFHEHVLLADCFDAFYVETLKRGVATADAPGGIDPEGAYKGVLLHHLAVFRTLRAARLVAYRGYALPATALLRGVVDEALLLGALAGGYTTFRKIEALDGISPGKGPLTHGEATRQMERAKEQERHRIFTRLIGTASGLDAATQTALNRWRRVFHPEVHGGGWTRVVAGVEWLAQGQPPSPRPRLDEHECGMYMNRADEVCWLLLRTMTFLQPTPHAFGDDWLRKWHVLDASLVEIVNESGRHGNSLAPAIAALVSARFSFSPETTCFVEG